MAIKQNAREKIRIGVIGAGWWATAAYLPLLAPTRAL